MFFRKKTSGGRAYLQIVENRREDGAVRQQVIATLGRLEDLRQSGQLERLLRSGARFADKAIVVGAVADGEATTSPARRIGAALAFERLWQETGCRAVVESLAGSRQHDFPLERAVFLTVLHRLFSGGSDRAADRWRQDYRIEGVEGLGLHHLYRAMGWLGEELAEHQQAGATPFAPRCLKDVMEEELFARRRDLFSTIDLVFMDTTSLYFEGAGGQTLGRRGFSKDHRPDLNQMILAVLLDGDGRPVCTEMWPGNTADVSSLIPAVDRLRKRFSINRVCVVADRGMISAPTVAALEERGLEYVLGVRERTDPLVRRIVLADRRGFTPLCIQRSGGAETQLFVKEVIAEGRRYIVCRNEAEAEKDAADRRAVVEALDRQLAELHRRVTAALLIDVLVGTFVTDTAAYATGRMFGSHKIAPSLSPNKTVEGLGLGMFTAVVAVFIAGRFQQTWLTEGDSLLLGAAVAVLGPIGDLFESLIKRDAGTKDAGNVLGAHGGALDRFDAIIFTVVAGYYVWVSLPH